MKLKKEVRHFEKANRRKKTLLILRILTAVNKLAKVLFTGGREIIKNSINYNALLLAILQKATTNKQ